MYVYIHIYINKHRNGPTTLLLSRVGLRLYAAICSERPQCNSGPAAPAPRARPASGSVSSSQFTSALFPENLHSFPLRPGRCISKS